MNLLLDLGNSRIKWALAQDGNLTNQGAGTLAELARVWQGLPLPCRILGCSVVSGEQQAAMEARVRQLWNLSVRWIVPEREALGVRNHYDVSRLGADRWAAVLGAHRLFPGEDLLVVSAGTAQVVDVLTAAGDFLGGTIQPGYQLMKDALADRTARLPRACGAFANFPVATDDAIETGCLNALTGAIEAMRGHLRSSGATAVRIVLTGGDAGRLAHRLEGKVSVVDNLPLQGLAALAAAEGAFAQ